MSDLRETLEAAVTEHESTSAEPAATESAPAPASSVEAPSASSLPDEGTSSTAPSGEGSGADPDKPNIEEVAGDQQPAEKPNETAAEREARHRVDRAPQSWKGEAKKLWEQLPLQVRQEVARREKDMLPIMAQAADHKQKIDAMVQVMMPHGERIRSTYGDPVKAVASLLQTEAVLHGGSQVQKAQLLAHIVKQFNVDINALDSALAGVQMPEQVQQQSNIEQLLEQRLAPFQQFLQTQQNRELMQRQQVEQQAVMTVQEMEQDIRYPYFAEVRTDMADIIEMNARRGIAISLEDAYTRAVRMNDGTFHASSVRDQTQGATQAALEAHRAAQAAKGASVQVTGSPTGNGRNAGDPSNLRSTIEAAFGGGRL